MLDDVHWALIAVTVPVYTEKKHVLTSKIRETVVAACCLMVRIVGVVKNKFICAVRKRSSCSDLRVLVIVVDICSVIATKYSGPTEQLETRGSIWRSSTKPLLNHSITTNAARSIMDT